MLFLRTPTVTHTPITLDDVESAPVPDAALHEDLQNARMNFNAGIVAMRETAADVRMALGRATLDRLQRGQH